MDETTAEMKEDVKTLDRVIRELDDTASRAKVLRNEVRKFVNIFRVTMMNDVVFSGQLPQQQAGDVWPDLSRGLVPGE